MRNRTKVRAPGLRALLAIMVVAGAACDDTTAVETETALQSVTPAGGTVNVMLDAPVEVVFDAPMHHDAMHYAAVHEGGVTGPEVDGTWVMHDHGTTMRFTPDAGWHAGTEYTIHLGGGMMDASGEHVDLATHGSHMGGMWATESMMGGSGMGGMHGDHDHMGVGWADPDNGSYGMLFTFMTAG
jgi:hypothetical protein